MLHSERNKRGSIIVDAAITLPIFIIAIAMLLYGLLIINKEETETYAMVSEAEALSVIGGIQTVVNDSSKELYIDHLCYDIKILNNKFPFAAAFFKRTVSEITMPYRPFVGESDDPYSSLMVIIFPKNEGKEKYTPKYHGPSCWQLKAHRKDQMKVISETEAEKRGYQACLSCGGK